MSLDFLELAQQILTFDFDQIDSLSELLSFRFDPAEFRLSDPESPIALLPLLLEITDQ